MVNSRNLVLDSINSAVTTVSPLELPKGMQASNSPLSKLNAEALVAVQVRMEPVQRIIHCRHVKCGRKIIRDKNHGEQFEYLVEFFDGSKSWKPSYNIAEDLKAEFYHTKIKKGKEVQETVGATTNKVTVKRLDGSTETIDRADIFWDEEATPAKLANLELEALLHIHHHVPDHDHALSYNVSFKSN